MSKNLVHQITSGVAGWLTYEQMRGGVDNLSEASLYKPIEEIAKGRRFYVWNEFPIPKQDGVLGSPKEVDFVIVDKENCAILALEVKYLKSARIRMAGSITRDALKLLSLKNEDVETQRLARRKRSIPKSVVGFSLTRAVIIVWRRGDIVYQISREDFQIRCQFMGLIRSMLPEGIEPDPKKLTHCFEKGTASKPVGNKYGSLRQGATITAGRFWVAAFVEMPWWHEIKAT